MMYYTAWRPPDPRSMCGDVPLVLAGRMVYYGTVLGSTLYWVRPVGGIERTQKLGHSLL